MKKLLSIIIIVVVLGAAWYLLSPLFIDNEVQEDFPAPQNISEEELEALRVAAEEPDVVMADPMPDSAPVVLARGEFKDQDRFHKGSGSATVYELPDGSRVLRFENFDVTNGPDLHVLIAGHEAPQNHDDLEELGYIDLGQLKGNKGDQNYDIPADTLFDGINSVVIYCEPFSVVFSTAVLN